MKYLKVVNFGPIKSLELNLEKKIQVVIGPQASGKSTLVKIIYFCRKIKDYVLEYLSEQGNFPNDKAYSSQQLYQQFILYIRRKFMGCFGTTNIYNTLRLITITILKLVQELIFHLILRGLLVSSFQRIYKRKY